MRRRRALLGLSAAFSAPVSAIWSGISPGVGSGTLATALAWPSAGHAQSGGLDGADTADALPELLAGTDLVYLTPLRSDGAESRCQAEVWFVAEGTDIWVVTATDAWRARAVRSGRTRARLWIGDLGVWTRAEGKYRELPSLDAEASLVTDAALHNHVLSLFGAKYPVSWVLWGPRFRKGLADGSRVMLCYKPSLGAEPQQSDTTPT